MKLPGPKNPVLHSLGHAVLVLLYVIGVATFFFNAQTWFGNQRSFLIPAAMLMFLVLSVAIMSILVFGRPVLMYLEGQKKDALKFLGFTVLWLFVLTLLVFVVLFFTR